MSAAVFLSRILGLVREQVFAGLFGASHATDAFQIAFRIPNLLRDLFAEGAMSAALVPTFVDVRSRSGLSRAWQVASRVFVFLFLIVSAIALLGVLFAEDLAGLYADAYRSVPGKFELTVLMTRVMMPYFPLVAVAAAFMAILNACGRFFVPSFASAMFNLVSIVVGVVGAKLLPSYGIEPIVGMAIGVVCGGAVQALIQWPLLLRQGYRFSWSGPDSPRALQDPALKRMMLLMVPGTLGLAATQINILVNSIFATQVGEGAVSWLNYAFRLMQFPIGVFGVSLAAATLPVFSRSWSDGDYQGAQDSLVSSLKRVFAINFPASAGLAFLGVPIIALIFEYGRFEASDTLATANALAAYAVGLTAYSAVKVLVPACYAMGATRVAVLSSVFSVISNLGFNALFVSRYGFVGLAMGTSITAILNAVLLWVFLSRRMKSRLVVSAWGPLLGALFKTLGAAVLMGVFIYAVDRYLLEANLQEFGTLGRILRVLIGVLLGVGSYGLFSIGLKSEESLALLQMIKRRLG